MALPFTEHNPDGRGDYFSNYTMRPQRVDFDANPWIYYGWADDTWAALMKLQGKTIPADLLHRVPA